MVFTQLQFFKQWQVNSICSFVLTFRLCVSQFSEKKKEIEKHIYIYIYSIWNVFHYTFFLSTVLNPNLR